MKKLKTIFFITVAVICAMCFAACSSSPKVTLTENENLYILDNGIVTVKVAKASGDLVSLRYEGKEMLATILTSEGEPDLQKDPPGANMEGLNRGMTDHQYGFWSHDAMGPKDTDPAIATITIDPKKNGGKIAEVSIKGISNGRKMGTGPGASATGQFVADIDIRYTLEAGKSGVYTYCYFEHKPEYPYTQLGEARFCAKLADFFDWMSVADNRNMSYPKELREGDKYIYTVTQSVNPAFGWSSTTEKVGLFIINASMEYMSGGPTKVEFLGHRDTNPIAAPCVLNYWRSSHYGGAEVNVAAGEHWKKVIGPFMIYVNSGETPQTIYDDAKNRAKIESSNWPYNWVSGVDFTTKKDRATVKGQLALNDGEYTAPFSKLTIGLTAPAYTSPREQKSELPAYTVNWQRDAKNYQFWTNGSSDGTFEMKNVRPGSYSLYAFADGVLGEYLKTDIKIEAGKNIDLGQLTWTPVRKGRQLWDIGIPNRSPSEFFKAEDYWKPDIDTDYAKYFPNDITYTIGKSDFSKDWFFQHIPHFKEELTTTATSIFGGRNFTREIKRGANTPYTVVFNLPSAPTGKATLRFAICGTGSREIIVKVNEKNAGTLADLPLDGAIARHGFHAIWYERELAFDASLMNEGQNTIAIIIPEGQVENGMLYDYIRLELSE